MKPATRATRSVVFTVAVFPVASRYCVTGFCSGSATVTFGGGGATYWLLSPHADNTTAARAAVTVQTPTRRMQSPPNRNTTIPRGAIALAHVLLGNPVSTFPGHALGC